MKILVVATGQSLQAEVDEDFGHAPFFIVYDSETKEYEAYVNHSPDSATGSGIMAAEEIVRLKPDVVITGGIGVHGQRALNDAGIKFVMEEEGTVLHAIEKYLKKNPKCETKDQPAVTAPPE